MQRHIAQPEVALSRTQCTQQDIQLILAHARHGNTRQRIARRGRLAESAFVEELSKARDGVGRDLNLVGRVPRLERRRCADGLALAVHLHFAEGGGRQG